MPANDLYHLIYLSMASFEFSQAELVKLLKKNRQFNETHGITGLLLYSQGHFMQLIEGSREEVMELMKKIEKDERHQHVTILEEGPVAQRLYPDWSMAFLDFENPKVRSLPGYSRFMETSLLARNGAVTASRAEELLEYFKAVMAMSDAEVLALAQTIKTDG